MSVPADRFDEIRRKWIARHQHTFIFQKRRAEILARQIRDRATEKSGARVDPADDDIIHPLIARPVKTVYAGVDMAIVATAALLAPLGWMGGKLINRILIQLIPAELRDFLMTVAQQLDGFYTRAAQVPGEVADVGAC